MGTTTLALAPILFSSCKKNLLENKNSFQGEVLIVGAGIAGLYTAKLLKEAGIRFTILEASDRVGGRIHSHQGFADFDVELGAEEIWGSNSIWFDFIKSNGATFIDQGGDPFYFFNGSIKDQIGATQNTFFNVMNDIIAGIKDYTGSDVTAEAFANLSGISDNVLHLFNAQVANAFGTCDEKIGMHGLRNIEEKRTSGTQKHLVKNFGLSALIELALSDIISQVQLNTIVAEIDYSGAKINVTDSNGNVYSADQIIITVPLGVLKNNDISFIPELPVSHTYAMQQIGFDQGLKIVLEFDERVWPSNMGKVFGPGLVPEFSVTSAIERGTSNRWLTAFVNGANAEALTAMNDNMIPHILGEVDQILGDVSSHYVSHLIRDWGNDPFYRGVMSYDKPGTGNARTTLSQPVANKIRFAGEAVHAGGHQGTVHGAMESALQAVLNLVK